MAAILGYAHLDSDPAWNGGDTRVANSGVRVFSIWVLGESGWPPEKISQEYALPLGSVFSALAYAADHPEEMRACFELDHQAAAEFQEQGVLPPKLRAALEHNPTVS
jgi:uncharacterized protein (DUF433 family)